jgi:hypothetical protein
MPTKSRTKFISDVAHTDVAVKVAKPFKMEKDEQRRYIRLEISSPMDLRKIKDIAGNYWPGGDRRAIDGLILNISGGGVLVEVSQPVNEGDVVAMHFTLQDVESLDNVLGLVKRAERDEGSFLIGIEFITRESLVDLFSEGEMELLSDELTGFNEQVRTVLNKYVRKEKLSEGR